MRQTVFFCIIIIISIGIISSCVTSQTRYDEAFAYYMYKDNDSALEMLSLIIDTDPGFYPSYLLKAEIYIQNGDSASAEKALMDAKAILPDNYMIPFNLGNIYFNNKEYQKAIDQYSDSIKTNTAFNRAYLNRANTYMTIKKYRNALMDYEVFIKLTPEGYENVRKLAKILRQDLEALSQ